MQDLFIPQYRNIKLNSFRPLCMNNLGHKAISTFGFPPFIDASCRREPDFQNPCPSISSLCRQGVFAPHLQLGDIVLYITVKGKYTVRKEAHHRLVAVLQVENIFSNHAQGQIEYLSQGYETPSNCIVPGNYPYNFDQTAGDFKTKKELNGYLRKDANTQFLIGRRRLKHWDKKYSDKSLKWSCFVKTKILYMNLQDPKPIFVHNFNAIFNKMPNTRTPNKISSNQFTELLKLIDINVTFGKQTLNK